MKKYMTACICFIAVAIIVSARYSFADIIPADRSIDWSKTGVVQADGTKGIPNITTICPSSATIDPAIYGNGTTDATQVIQTAINNCPAGQVLSIPAGTYKLTANIGVDHPIVIRGAGANKTTLLPGIAITFSPVPAGAVLGGEPNGGRLNVVNWTAGYTKGDTVITLASSTGLSVGQEIGLDQLNDTSVVNVNGIEGSQNCARNGTTYDPGGNTRCAYQMTRITAINGNTVTIDNPLYYTHQASLQPQVFWIPGYIRYAGIENLKIDGHSIGPGPNMPLVVFGLCSNCWAKGVEIGNVYRSAIMFELFSYRPEVRNCYFHDSDNTSMSTRYGVEFLGASAGLLENNIFSNIHSGIVSTQPTSGFAAGYNYIRGTVMQNGPDTAWVLGGIETHIVHTYQNLFEGNVVSAVVLDNTWGSGSHNTLFRNRSFGYESMGSLYVNGAHPLDIAAWNRYTNVIGNVLGYPGWHVYYELTPWTDDGTKDQRFYVYSLGAWGYDASQADTLVKSTMLRGGNYDTATGAVVWQANAPDSASTYLPQQSLPASLYLTGKPGWWNSSPWPAIGPDVSGGPQDPIGDPGGHAFPIPAQQCYQNQNLGNGGTFDPSQCYAAAAILYGDVSENGTISSYDASLTAQYSVGLITLTATQLTKADVSGNGSVTSYDASLIAQYAVGLITKFPVQG